MTKEWLLVARELGLKEFSTDVETSVRDLLSEIETIVGMIKTSVGRYIDLKDRAAVGASTALENTI